MDSASGLSDESITSAISSPSRFNNVVAGAMLKSYSETILKYIEDRSQTECLGLLQAIETLDDGLGLCLWRPETSHSLQLAGSVHTQGHRFAICQLALALWLAGAQVKSEFRFEPDDTLIIGKAVIRLDKPGTIVFDSDRLICSELGNDIVSDALYTRRSSRRIWSSALSDAIMVEPLVSRNDGLSLSALWQDNNAQQGWDTETARSSVARLERNSADIVRWVAGAVRSVYVRSAYPTPLRALSSELCYGAIALGSPINDRWAGELIVHEASHQYLMPLTAMVKLFDDDAPEAFHPISKTPRPLVRLMYGYHALTAVLEYYVGLGAAAVACKSEFLENLEYLGKIEEQFVLHEKFFTEAGLDFWSQVSDCRNRALDCLTSLAA